MTFFWLLLLAHGVSDFLLQTDSISSAKCRNQWQGYVLHGCGVFFCTLAAGHFYGWVTALIAAGVVTVTHLSVDWLKNMGRLLGTRMLHTGSRPRLAGFLVDQTMHIFVLVWVWHLLDGPAHNAVTAFYSAALAPVNHLQLPDPEMLVSVLAIYVMVAFGGAVMIRMTLDQLYPPDPDSKPETPAGKYIGILERMLILTLAATDALAAIGFVFTAKSIARFDEISKNRKFAEYYLIGTLLSFLLALIAGLLIRTLT